MCGRIFLPIGVSAVITCVPAKNSPRNSIRPRRLSTEAGSCPVSFPDRITSCCRGRLEGDVGARVARADDQHRPGLQLREVAVVARVELGDARIELAGEVGDVRLLEDARRDDDVVGLEPPVARGARRSGRPPSSACRPPCRCAPAARTAPRTPRGSRPSRPWSGTRSRAPGSASPAGRRGSRASRAAASPTVPPAVAEPLARVEDHERAALLLAGGSRPRGPAWPPPMMTVSYCSTCFIVCLLSLFDEATVGRRRRRAASPRFTNLRPPARGHF